MASSCNDTRELLLLKIAGLRRARSSDNFAMDADEITRIEATRSCRIAASVRNSERSFVTRARRMTSCFEDDGPSPSECAATPSATQVDELEMLDYLAAGDCNKRSKRPTLFVRRHRQNKSARNCAAES